jgi:uncharacterized SAM-binding protein YcdF (DUF218 family)
VVLVLTSALTIYFQRDAVLSGLGRWLNVGCRLDEPVDAVMVLGGGATTRPFVAVEIMRAGLARKILIPNVESSDENRDGLAPTEHAVLREVVLRSGISPDAIVLLTQVVDSTEREAQAAAAYLKAHPGERLAIVTNNYHTRRARWLFARECGDDARNVIFIGAPTDGFDASNWWRFEPGVISYLTEYLKLARTLVH